MSANAETTKELDDGRERQRWAIGIESPDPAPSLVSRVVAATVTAILLVVLIAVLVKTVEVAWSWVS